MLRLSSYNIYVPLENGTTTALVHGITGAIDLVEHEWAANMKALRWERFSEADKAQMISRGYLTERTPTEEQQRAMMIGSQVRTRAERSVSFVLMPTTDCNLACSYCFQSSLRSGAEPAPLLSEELVEAAFAAMSTLRAQVNSKAGRIVLFGGEPLLRRNRALLSRIFERGREGGYRFDAITNGTETDAFAEFLGSGCLESVQITLDGPPAIHDSLRCGRDGSGSFEAIRKNIDNLLRHGVQVDLRINLGWSNLDNLDELIELFQSFGWIRHPKFLPYCAPIHSCEGQARWASLQRAVIEKVKGVNGVLRSVYNREVLSLAGGTLHRKLFNLLRGNLVGGLTPVYCGAHMNMYVFAPDGSIYTCWEAVGLASARVGAFYPQLQFSSERDRWFQRSSLTIPRCQSCRYVLFCGGGCGLRASTEGDGFDSSYCDGFAEAFRFHVQHALRRRSHGQEERNSVQLGH